LCAFACFVFYAAFLQGINVNFVAATVFSAVPLAAGVIGFAAMASKRRLDVFSAVNVSSLFAFNLLLIAYLAVAI